MTEPLWKQEERLDWQESAGHRTTWLELVVLAVGIISGTIVTAVAMWLW